MKHTTLFLFLALVIMALTGLMADSQHEPSHYDARLHIWVDDDPALGFDEAAQLARRLDGLADQIEATGWRPEVSPRSLNDWTRELLGMYSYEGAVSETRIPEQVVWVPYVDGMSHNHKGGQSNCATHVWLNGRVANPVSAWYRAHDWPVTLAHELAHIQQGWLCAFYPSEIVENTAQLVAWEVVASMANGGNQDAAYALIFELRSVAVSAALAIDGNRGRDLVDELYGDDPIMMAKIDRADRFWHRDPESLEIIRAKYSLQPLDRLFRRRGVGVIRGLALHNGGGALVVDDLLYFLDQAESLIGGYIEEGTSGQ